MGELTIVIPVYTAEDYLDKCIKSIPKKYQIIIVDDCSPKQSTQDYLDSIDRPNVKVYKRKTNQGFAKTVNYGVSKVKTEFVLILNSDVKFTSGKCINSCLSLLKDDDLIGVVGTKLLYGDNTIQHAGMGMNWEDRGGNTITRGQGEPNIVYSTVEEVLFVTGAFLMLRKKVFNEVGKLPTCYGRGYYEDPEFCVKIRQHGYKVIYNGDVWAYHYANKSFQSSNLSTQSEENFKRFQLRNLYILREWERR